MSNSRDYDEPDFAYTEKERLCPRLRWCRNRVFDLLNRVEGGTIHVTDMAGSALLGSCKDKGAPPISLRVFDSQFYGSMVAGGSMAAAEGYMEGRWSCSDLAGLLALLTRNKAVLGDMESGMARFRQQMQRFAHWFRKNTVTGSKRNIEAHYDLSNDFFGLFLDSTMNYSSGIFADERCGLEEASIEKMERLCRKLNLQREDHLLEIGTGWGAMAIHAAMHHGCRVTTTTISEAQYEYAQARIDAAGLSDRVTLLKRDYRTLTGSYDKLLSIEMIEAVGHAYLPTFFEKCGELLKPGGRMALQAITIADQEYDRYRKGTDFINRHVFPGGCLPSVTRMCEAMTGASDLRLSGLEDITPHYARTLQAWRARFMERLDEVRALGFSEAFIRMWEYYFCYCEAGFRGRTIGTVQMELFKG